MRATLLERFPERTYPLIIVSDPDLLLTGEQIAAELAELGFRYVHEADPVLLRLRVEQSRPWNLERPLIIASTCELSEFPYDLWQNGHRVSISVAEFLPNLSLAILRSLDPATLDRLMTVTLPTTALTRLQTERFILKHAFNAELDRLAEPSTLIGWLRDMHERSLRLPDSLRTTVLTSIGDMDALKGWPLADLIESSSAFHQFMNEQWIGFVQRSTGRRIQDQPVPYIVDFGNDELLQDDLAKLVRAGAVVPAPVEIPGGFPPWARPGLIELGESQRLKRSSILVSQLEEWLAGPDERSSWQTWKHIARAWAELDTLYDSWSAEPSISEFVSQCRAAVDEKFAVWIRQNYSPLASLQVPEPHHLYHVPELLARAHRKRPDSRTAMLIIDGMSLVDWVEIRDTWQAKHPEWRINDRLLLAQIPTITSVSRQALVSGLRPIDFADSMDSTDRESVRWRSFWERQSLPSGAVAYRHISLDQIADLDSGLLHMRMLCLVDTSIDERIHGTTMGAAELRSDRRVWIEGYGLLIESLLERLLQAGFSVWITSDHGHVAARGIGQPNDGVIADVRAKRARIYQTEEHAHDVLSRFARTTLWGDDGLLPRNMWVVNPSDREAFTRFNDLVVTHGGLNIEEMIVPLISIERIQHD